MSIVNYGSSVKKYHFKSVFVNNLITIILLICVPFIFMSMFFSVVSNKTLEKELSENIDKRAKSVKASTESFIQSIDKMLVVIMQKSEYQKVMSLPEGVVNLSSEYMTLGKIFSEYILANSYIKNIQIYSEVNERMIEKTNIVINNSEKESEWFRRYKLSDDEFIIFADRAADSDSVIFMHKYIAGKKTLGMILAEISIPEMLRSMNIDIDDFSEKIMIADNDDNIIFSSYKNDIGMNVRELFKEYDGDNIRVLSYDNLKKNTWSFIYASNDTYYSNARNKLRMNLMALSIFLIILCVGIAFYISVKTYRPLTEVMKSFNSAETETDEDLDEVGYILRNIIKLNTENDIKKAEMQDKVEKMNAAYIQALQSQINPHFLCNTLESIKWMAVSYDTDKDKINYVIDLLYDFLRYSMELDRYIVDVSEEIENTRTYIQILNVRYEDKFDVNWDIKPDIEQVAVPKMSVQPIIENAITHGVLRKRGRGLVNVSIYRENGDVYVSVEDNGIGITEDKLAEIHAGLKDMQQKLNRKNIGLQNVNIRTKLICGEDYGISITSEYGKGTKVILRLAQL